MFIWWYGGGGGVNDDDGRNGGGGGGGDDYSYMDGWRQRITIIRFSSNILTRLCVTSFPSSSIFPL